MIVNFTLNLGILLLLGQNNYLFILSYTLTTSLSVSIECNFLHHLKMQSLIIDTKSENSLAIVVAFTSDIPVPRNLALISFLNLSLFPLI